MSQVVSLVKNAEGNTKPPRYRARRWVLTLNNYTDEEYVSCLKFLEDYEYIVGKEVGKEGTPHLQMYFEGKNQIDFSYVKKNFPRAHIEKASGSYNKNFDYCSKEENYVTNMIRKVAKKNDKIDRHVTLLELEYSNIIWKEWQQKVIDIVESEADTRKIHWFHEENGNCGKSFLAKYLLLKYDAIICSGKKDDVFNQVCKWLESHPASIGPKLVLMDVPRCQEEKYISYQTLECLKNGMLYSGKYEGGVCAFKAPHIIVFANIFPDLSQLSMDRWHIVNIESGVEM